MNQFILSCESTTDLPYHYLAERKLPVICYTYIINNHAYEDNMERNPDLMPKFYKKCWKRDFCQRLRRLTKQATMIFFESLLEQGDLLHITFSSGMSGSAKKQCLSGCGCIKEKNIRTESFRLLIRCPAQADMVCS